MSLRQSEIAVVVAELQELAGARIDAVRVHSERALTLEVHRPGGSATLLVSAEPDRTRIHLAWRRPPAPPEPFPFQAALRRELEGARLASLEVAAGDRVVALGFERGEGRARLVAELTGRHGNLFLLDAGSVILASAGRNLSQRRDLLAGRPYLPPAPRAAGEAEPSRFPSSGPTPFPVSLAIEEHYRALEEERLLAEGRRRLREPLRAAAARARRALGKLSGEAARVPEAESDRRAADLVKQNLRALSRGTRQVTLTEWTEEGPREVTLALDPALSPRENMERYYRRYRRIADSAARVEARAAEVQERLSEVERLLSEVERAPADALARLEREARRFGAAPRPARPPRRRAPEERALPYRSFRSLGGVPILVGKGAAENDELTVKVAKGNDLWLHARGRPGAHVVVRLAKGQAPDQESLLDAAHLAAHFSDARGEPSPEVVYTRAKHVRKVKGAAPGAVTYSQERSLLLRLEPARLERLLQSEAEAEPA
ncbi:MAG TPA: NFACT RNA binding domain-containing protein [Anaeromyxobacteraceae bacterium]|nr:NFACT RNA binding domain-containing protein [Anaeromyxobacteraceae bacterium]